MSDYAKESEYELALKYHRGCGVEQDEDKAISILKPLSKNGDVPSIILLFDIYWHIGGNDNEMYSIVSNNVDRDSGEIYVRISRCYRVGRGIEKNLPQAASWLRKSIDLGCTSQLELVDLLFQIDSISSTREAISIVRPLVESGNPDAMVRLSKAYREGLGVEQDFDVAIHWAKRAKDLIGNRAEFEYLASLWRSGSDNNLAKVISEALSLSDKHSIHQLLRYAHPRMVRQNSYCIRDLYRLLDIRDSKEYVQVLLLCNGQDDLEEAFQICKKNSIEDGWFRETYALMYYSGVGVGKDISYAKKLLSHCDSFRRYYPVAPYEWFVDSVYDYDDIYLYGTENEIRCLSCMCLQNHIYVKGVITDLKNDLLLWPSTTFKNIDTTGNVAILMISDYFIPIKGVDVYSVKNGNLLERNSSCNANCIEIESLVDNNYKIKYNCNEEIISIDILLKLINQNVNQFIIKDFNVLSLLWPMCKNYSNIFFDYSDLDLYICSNGSYLYAVSYSQIVLQYHIGRNISMNIDKTMNVCTYYGPMGDEFRLLSRSSIIEQKIGKPISVMCSIRGRDLLDLYGYDGIITSLFSKTSLLTYTSISPEECNIIVIPEKLYPYIRDCSGPILNLMDRRSGIRDYSSHYIKYIDYSDNVNTMHFFQYDNIDYTQYTNSILFNLNGSSYTNSSRPSYLSKVNEIMIQLSSKLKDLGYKVYQNYGGKNKSHLPNIKIINLPISELISLLPEIKMVISPITGFTEVMMLSGVPVTCLSDGTNFRKGMDQWCNNNYYLYNIMNNTIDDLVDIIIDNIKMITNPLAPIKREILPPSQCNIDFYLRHYVNYWIDNPEMLNQIYNIGMELGYKNGYRIDLMKKELEDCCSGKSIEGLIRYYFLNEFDVVKVEKSLIEYWIYLTESDRSSILERLVKCYLNGIDNPTDLNKASYILSFGKQCGYAWSDNLLMELLWKKKRPSDDLELYKIAINESISGNALSFLWIGRLYRDGRGVEKNYLMAAKWMRKARDGGIKWADWELFDILWRINTPDSLKEAISIAEPLAQSGNRELQGRMGRAYRDGKGVEKNRDLARVWFKKAADQDLAWAKKELADLDNHQA